MPDTSPKKNDEFDDQSSTERNTDETSVAYDEDLPTLTPKQSAFINNVLKGMTYVDAYKLAYDTSNQAQTTNWTASGELVRTRTISLWLSRAKEEGAIMHACTYDNHLNSLANLRDGARDAGQWSAAVKAEEARGHVAGLRITQIQDVSVSDAENALKALTKALGESAAAGIARSLGFKIEVKPPLIEGETQP